MYGHKRYTDWEKREIEEKSQVDAYIRAHSYTGYKHVPLCSNCDLQAVCDGFYSDYTGLFGSDEAQPVVVGERVTNPQYFSKHQLKEIHPDDKVWLEGEEQAITLLVSVLR